MVAPMSANPSPAMAQYLAAKRQHPDALLFFRMGDFYELFHDDAVVASRDLGITLTSRNKDGDEPVPMAGVPVRSLDNYLKRLVEHGHRVAICEQMQDPKEAKGVVERAVVRVVTPGTLTEDSLLRTDRANHLAALHIQSGRAGLAWVELSTGRFSVFECSSKRLLDEAARIEAVEWLHAEEPRRTTREPEADPAPDSTAALVTRLRSEFKAAFVARSPADFDLEGAVGALHDFFSTASLEGFGLEELPVAVAAAGALIRYLQETQKAALPHIRKIEVVRRGTTMLLDRATRQSLELVETMRGEGKSLLQVVDHTRTPMGARMLRSWVLAPRTDLDEIHARQSAVATLNEDHARLDTLRELLAGVHDLERLTARIGCGRANGRDLVALRRGVERLPELRAELAAVLEIAAPNQARRLTDLRAAIDPLGDVCGRIAATLVDEPPIGLKDGELIREGFDNELDELLALSRDSRKALAGFQAREAERLGLTNLKVGFNKVFGYYIEISNAQARDLGDLPPEYVRKQTTKNAERYVTDELKDFETKVLRAEDRSKELEYELFVELREGIAAETPRLQSTAAAIAELDVLCGFAAQARTARWCRPEIDDSSALVIRDGRHPVIEATHAAGTFVPNDTDLEPPGRRFLLLTGPNMAGKSTWIRQNALIVLLAQIGSFVPATSARIGLVDRVFTRVGSSDDISRGASTFMVEMTETANILNHATPKSLVILDEVGRGTSTYDGLALAWSIAEDLHDRVRCRTLFATHYHQLVEMAAESPGAANVRVAVREWGDEIVFMHRIEEGSTDRSYGLHVARLAGLPAGVLDRSRILLDELESGASAVSREALSSRRGPAQRQRTLFTPPTDSVLDEIKATDVEAMTPLEALQRLAAWRDRLRS
jgi:DNA mismatch repair protein MutS